ncbi:hypothetical protein BW730_00385 [Tessaracoccus aquimaris]|uniref:Uncharacterized protein n=1 Tax=Tessaracoccus aquimaris TaxID=1332264 RepID=A0A1Q2CJN7_9ACTN|nr:hypothetical protein BW730_00385 [Tessaracoccus aquimaris]
MLGTMVATATAEADENGRDEVGHGRYVISEDGASVQATITMTVTNTDTRVTPDNPGGRWLVTTVKTNIPASAESVKATSSGAALTVSLADVTQKDPNIRVATITVPELKYGETGTIVLTYTVPGAPFRAKDYTRIGRGYAGIGLWIEGDPGKTTAEVVAPTSMQLITDDPGYTGVPDGDTTVWTSKNSPVANYWAYLVLRDPSVNDGRTVKVGKATIALEALPGDGEWLDSTERALTEGLPRLEKLMGVEWEGAEVTLFEDLSVYTFGGYTTLLDKRTAGVTEKESPHDVLRQATSAWLGEDRLKERWLHEGIAAFVAYRASDGVGATLVTPKPGSGKGSLPLGQWQWTPRADPTPEEDYAYPTSHGTMRLLLDGLDDEAVARVLSGAVRGESAYEEPGAADGVAITDQRRFLDLVEVRGGNAKAADAYVAQSVFDAEQAKALEPRAAARAAYVGIDEKDGAWLPPKALRAQMAGWEFAEAEKSLAGLGDLPESAGGLQSSAEKVGLKVPASVRAAYDGADGANPDAAVKTLGEAKDVLFDLTGAIRSAQRGDGPFVGIGRAVLGANQALDRSRSAFESGDLDQARRSLSAYQDKQRGAAGVGIAIVVGAAVLLLGAVAGVLIWRRRRSRPSAAQAPPSADRLLSADPWSGSANASRPPFAGPAQQSPPFRGPTQGGPPTQGPAVRPPGNPGGQGQPPPGPQFASPGSGGPPPRPNPAPPGGQPRPGGPAQPGRQPPPGPSGPPRS